VSAAAKLMTTAEKDAVAMRPGRCALVLLPALIMTLPIWSPTGPARRHTKYLIDHR